MYLLLSLMVSTTSLDSLQLRFDSLQVRMDSMQTRMYEAGAKLAPFGTTYFNCFLGNFLSSLVFFLGIKDGKDNSLAAGLGLAGMITFTLIDLSNHSKITEAGKLLKMPPPVLPDSSGKNTK